MSEHLAGAADENPGTRPHYSTVSEPLYGLMAEFDDPEVLLEATQRAYTAGYRKMDAYSPFPVHGLSEALGFRNTRLPLIILIGGILGGLGGFYLQYWISVISYSINIGGDHTRACPAIEVV